MEGEKSFGMGSAALGVLMVGFFFLPWLSFKCDADAVARFAEEKLGQAIPESEMPEEDDLEFFSASGWQLAMGQASINTESSKFQEARQAGGISQDQFDTQIGEANEKLSESIPARPWFFASLAAGGVILLVGVASLSGSVQPEAGGKVVLLCGLIGLVLGFVAMGTDYYTDIEGQAAINAPPGMQPSDFLVTASRYGLWGTLLLNLGAMGLGASAKSAVNHRAATPSYAASSNPSTSPGLGSPPAPTFGMHRPSSGPSFRAGSADPSQTAPTSAGPSGPGPEADIDDISSAGPSI